MYTIFTTLVLCLPICSLIEGKFISPDLGLEGSYVGDGYKYTSHIGHEVPEEYSYHHEGPLEAYEIGKIGGYHPVGKFGGYGGLVGGPIDVYEPGKVVGYGGPIEIPKAEGIGYGGYGAGIGPYVGLGYRKIGGFVPGIGHGGYKGDIGLVGTHIGYDQGGLYPSAAGIGYGYGHYPYMPHSLHHHGINLGHGYGGGELEKNVYSDGKKNIIGEHFVKTHGEKGDSVAHGDSGYTADKVAVKDVKGDSVHFIDTDGGNKAHHNGKEYHGGQHFNKEGKSGSEEHEKQGHRKGHNIKGFKKSHHLDETGKTEQYFDEVHDEGGNYAFGGHAGKFGESGGSSFKGGVQDGKYSAGENKKEGYIDNEYVVDKEHAGSGKYGGNKFANNKEVYGLNKELGAHDLSGHHEYNNEYKKYPYYH